jgi:hypothetical protein
MAKKLWPNSLEYFSQIVANECVLRNRITILMDDKHQLNLINKLIKST